MIVFVDPKNFHIELYSTIVPLSNPKYQSDTLLLFNYSKSEKSDNHFTFVVFAYVYQMSFWYIVHFCFQIY